MLSLLQRNRDSEGKPVANLTWSDKPSKHRGPRQARSRGEPEKNVERVREALANEILRLIIERS